MPTIVRPQSGSVAPTAAPRDAATTDEAVVESDIRGLITRVNSAICHLTGYEQTDLVGTAAISLVAPEWTEFVLHQQERMVESLEEVTHYQCVLLSKHGARVQVSATSTLLRDNGEVIGGRIELCPNREHSAVERRLEESEERFRGAFEGAAIGMAMVSTDGRWLKVNRALCQLLGYSKDELLERTFQNLTHPEDLERDLASLRDVLQGNISWYHMEKRYIRKDGQIMWGLLAVSPVHGADGEPAYLVKQIHDISAAKQLELSATASLKGTTPKLSRRETQVLALLADGYLTAETAQELGIGEETVQTLVKRAMKKLSARNRTQAVASALRLRLLDA